MSERTVLRLLSLCIFLLVTLLLFVFWAKYVGIGGEKNAAAGGEENGRTELPEVRELLAFASSKVKAYGISAAGGNLPKHSEQLIATGRETMMEPDSVLSGVPLAEASVGERRNSSDSASDSASNSASDTASDVAPNSGSGQADPATFLSSFDRGHLERWKYKAENREESLPQKRFLSDSGLRLQMREEEFLRRYSPNVLRIGIYLEDMKTGRTFSLRGDQDFYSASTRKLAICTAVLMAVSDGKMKRDDFVSYLANKDYEGGAGSLQHRIKDGDAVALYDLIDYCCRESDNIATNMLIRKMLADCGSGGLAHYMTLITGRAFEYPNYYTPRQLAASVKSLCMQTAANPEFEHCTRALEAAEFNGYITRDMSRGSYFHKYGAYRLEAAPYLQYSNDIGVIYGENPLIFVVMTEWNGGEPPYALMSELGAYFRYIVESGDFPDSHSDSHSDSLSGSSPDSFSDSYDSSNDSVSEE